MRYILEKYQGPKTRYTCPKCGRKGQFTRYIDTTTGNYVADDVGMCNRIEKCGYHKPPGRNPIAKALIEGSLKHAYNPFVRRVAKSSDSEICTIPKEIMEESLDQPPSAYHIWLESIVGERMAYYLKTLYNIGSTKDGRVIFWQVDSLGRVRTGKVMRYDPKTGKRVKEGTGNCDWMHSTLKREGRLSKDWTLSQCLYGENLATTPTPTAFPIAIVESYKTAHIAAAAFQQFIWTAVDNINGLTEQRLSKLHGKKVILFPDAGLGHRLWLEKIGAIARKVGFQYTVSDWLLRNATTEQLVNGADIADVIIDSLALAE